MFTKPTLPAAHLKDRSRTPSAGREQAALSSRVRLLQTRVADLEEQIRALRRSTSWRVSAPLRWLARRIKRDDGPLETASLRGSEGYGEWIRLYDSPPLGRANPLAEQEGPRLRAPSFSVLLLVEAVNPASIAATCASIGSQNYGEFELVMAADPAAISEYQSGCMAAGCAHVNRSLVPLAPGEPFARSLNAAIALARGDWLLLLSPGDVLPSYALEQFGREIAAHPDAQIVYADEDMLDGEGRRQNPAFKPDWDPELFHAHDYLSGASAIARKAVLDIGGLREAFEPAPIYDLVLRLSERIDPRQIRHVPRVLVHKPGAGADAGGLSRARDAHKRALEEHFARLGRAAHVLDTGDRVRVRYDLPAELPLVSLIVPTRNALALLRQCVESIVAETSYPNFELLIVDNGSDDPATLAYLDELRRQSSITVIRDDQPFNYSALNNLAVRHARGEMVGLVNNDIEVVSPDWLGEMVSLALQPDVGAVGAKLLYPDSTVQHGGIVLGIGGGTSIAGHANRFLSAWDAGYMGRCCEVQSFSAVTAACMVVRKALYESLGGLNEDGLKVAFNDVDFCLRLKEAGYRNLWTPHAILFHHESASRGSDLAPERRQRFEEEQTYMRSHWGGRISAGDTAYNPNLTLHGEDFGLAWPPRVPWLAGAAKP